MTFRRTDGVLAALLVLAALGTAAAAAVVIPPAPPRHLNDYAQLLSAADVERLDRKLVSLEQSSTVQLVVALFPALPESASLEDFTVRTAQAWKVGQQKPDNGVVLFVFVKDRKTRLEVGYGLEDKIPDAIAKRILQDVMGPHFKQGNFAAGLDAAIDAIVAAATGAPLPAVAPRPPPSTPKGVPPQLLLLIVVILIIVVFVSNASGGGGGTYYSSGWNSGSGSGWSSGGGGWSGGGSSGGGFSGGGGSFGGGGASGDW